MIALKKSKYLGLFKCNDCKEMTSFSYVTTIYDNEECEETQVYVCSECGKEKRFVYSYSQLIRIENERKI